MRNVLFVISGPSGVGKGTLVRALVEGDPRLWLSVSCTTRAPRAAEKHGEAYFFITKEEFERRIAENDFLEYNNHFEHYYGTPLTEVKEALKSKSVILEIEPDGGLRAAKRLREEGERVALIMITPPSFEELRARILHRGAESEEQLRERRERAEYELAKMSEYDYSVLNDDFKTALAELKNIIDKEINMD